MLKNEDHADFRKNCKILFGQYYHQKPDGSPISDDQLQVLINSFCEHLKSEGVTEKEPNDARKHFKSWAKSSGIKKDLVKPVKGNSKSKSSSAINELRKEINQ